MRTLSASLLAEQRSSSTQPYVRVRLFDHDVGSVRLRWERWYSGTEAAGPCVAAVPDDGSLLRARIDAATGAPITARDQSGPVAAAFVGRLDKPGASARNTFGLSQHAGRSGAAQVSVFGSASKLQAGIGVCF